MWQIKRFKTLEAGKAWIEAHGHKIQWNQVFIENVPFAVEYRKLRVIDIR